MSRNNNYADRLLHAIDVVENPSCGGLDPIIGLIPKYIKDDKIEKYGDTKEAVARSIIEFNKGLIDATFDFVRVYKPQSAHYEKYGHWGIFALEETLKHIRHRSTKKNPIIAKLDVKKNDIGSTVTHYAEGIIGDVELCSGNKVPGYDFDAFTVTPYIGSDTITPITDVMIEKQDKCGKGVIVLAKTSNDSSGELQDVILENGIPVYQHIARLINQWGENFIGDEYGYSSVCAVVGSTFPEIAEKIRIDLPNGIFLGPGVGAQKADINDIASLFKDDGFGAIPSNSGNFNFAYLRDWKDDFGPEDFDLAANAEMEKMHVDITKALKDQGKLAW